MDLASHLLTCLALPQVSIVEEGTSLPASVHSAVIFGPKDWKPRAVLPSSIDLWNLVDGNADAHAVVLPGSERIELAATHTPFLVEDGRRQDGPVDRLQQTLFWLSQRLFKAPPVLSRADYEEWKLALRLIGVEPGGASYWRRIAAELDGRRFAADEDVTHVSQALNRKLALAAPWMLVREAADAAEQRTSERAQSIAALVRDVLSRSNTGRRLAAVGVSALLLGDEEIARVVRDRFAGDEWRRSGVAFPLSAPGAAGFTYSPLIAIWHFLDARREHAGFQLPETVGAPVTLFRPLTWKRFDNGLPFDSSAHRISRSLVDNWVTLHTAPGRVGAQYKLDRSNYRRDIAMLEKLWITLFREMQRRKERPLIRLRPWPAPYKAAVSLRYDVDRPVGQERVAELVELQSKAAGAPCGSWYFFADDPSRSALAIQLRESAQEIGLHLQSTCEALPGFGVTHHSAPTSDYWRGDATNAMLDRQGAIYGEFLAAQTPAPRPAWIVDERGGRRGDLWITPIYFPLEGSTSNHTLEYFDQLIGEFREAVSSGGHVIIGSHPDVDQRPLIELLMREDFSQVWFASVRDVVERCRNVLEPGRIRIEWGPEDCVHLWSDHPLANITIEVWRSDEVTPRTIVQKVQVQGRTIK